MKQFKQLKTLMGGLTLSIVMIASSAASAFAAPATSATPPTTNQLISGPQAKAPVEPGTVDAKATEKLGPTSQIKVKADGTPDSTTNVVAPRTGAVSGVDFQTFYNYCQSNLLYTTVRNTTTTTQYIRVLLYNQNAAHDMYTSVAPGGSYTYPAFYGVNGAYSAYLYVYNGSSYAYDEYQGGTHTCNVSVVRDYNTGGWVRLKIQNIGTSYATQISTELAPYPGSGTYTGTQYDYPVAGGAAIYRWFQVGTQPYGIVSSTYGSINSPYLFSGDL